MIISDFAFNWMLSGMLLALSAIWSIYDGRLLVRLLRDKEKRGDPAHSDKIFGSIIGLALCAVGALGLVNFHLELF